MSKIARNSRARNANNKKRLAVVSGTKQKLMALDNICEKHKIGGLTFSECKFASHEGVVSYIDYKKILANMKIGITVMCVRSVDSVEELVYDIHEIEQAKKKRNEEKALKEKEDREKIQNDEATEEATEVTTEDATEGATEDVTEETTEEATEEATEDATENATEVTTEETIEDATEATSKKKSKKKDRSAQAKRDRAVRDLRAKMAQKQKESGNKYYRKFMSDIRSKFNLEPVSDIRYLELKVNSTKMVVDGPTVYRLEMPLNVTDDYYLFIGDLQMKNGLIKTIDPTYKFDNVISEHYEMLERIKAKEKANTSVFSDELDDLKDVDDLLDDNL